MAVDSPSLVPLLFFARVSGLAVAMLVLLWALAFNSSFLIPNSSSQEYLIYEVLHPLFMVIGFILISGEAILVHRWLPGSRNFKKSVHLCLQGVALASGLFGIWTRFQGEDGIVANFYSLHSWMGLICVSLFGAQYEDNSVSVSYMIKGKMLLDVLITKEAHRPGNGASHVEVIELWGADVPMSWLIGFLSFWHRGEARTVRLKVLPWHVFVGLYTYGLAVVTAETGLLEKLTFLQTKRNLSRYCPESMIVNSLGLGLALLCGIVILAAVSPKHQTLQTKFMYPDAKCLSS